MFSYIHFHADRICEFGEEHLKALAQVFTLESSRDLRHASPIGKCLANLIGRLA